MLLSKKLFSELITCVNDGETHSHPLLSYSHFPVCVLMVAGSIAFCVPLHLALQPLWRVHCRRRGDTQVGVHVKLFTCKVLETLSISYPRCLLSHASRVRRFAVFAAAALLCTHRDSLLACDHLNNAILFLNRLASPSTWTTRDFDAWIAKSYVSANSVKSIFFRSETKF